MLTKSLRFFISPSFFTSLGGLLLSVNLAAENTLQIDSLDVEMEIQSIIITGRREAQLQSKVIGSIGQVDQDEITRISHQHISQAAARIPGVWISRGNGQELLAAVRSPVFTGAGSCAEVLTSEDSLPIRPTGMCNVNQLFEVNTEQASGIEIWRGPGTVFYGSNAMHGVINIVSPQINNNTMSMQVGSNAYKRIKAGWAREFSDHRIQVAANGTSDGGFKNDSGFDQQKVSVKHAWSHDNSEVVTHLTGVNLNQETAGYIKGFKSYSDDATWKENPNPEAYRDASAVRLSSKISGERRANGAVDNWQVTPFMRRSAMTFLQHYLPGKAQEKNGQTSAGFQSTYQTQRINSVNLWLGMDLEFADMFVQEFQANPLGAPDNVRFQGQHYDFEVNSRQVALFANSEWVPTQSLTVEAGLRYESIHYDYQNNMISGSTRDDGTLCSSDTGSCRYYRPEDRSDSNDNLNYQLGLLYSPFDKVSSFIRIASAYRAPQINELYRLQKEQEIAVISSEQVNSIEAGIRYQVSSLFSELSFYNMDKDQVIVKDSNSFVVNDGKTSHRGVEWQLNYQANENWQLSTTASWAKHKYSYARLYGGINIKGNDVDTAPRWQGNLRVLYQPSDETSAELEWIYLGKYFLDPQNNHQYDGHKLVNVRMVQSLGSWNLSAQLTNILDERIADRADYAYGSYRYFVGEGRGMNFEVKRTF